MNYSTWNRLSQEKQAEMIHESWEHVEEGDMPLEKSLELYERGVQLSRFCHAKLEAAERRIEILNERGEIRQAPPSLGADPDGTAR